MTIARRLIYTIEGKKAWLHTVENGKVQSCKQKLFCWCIKELNFKCRSNGESEGRSFCSKRSKAFCRRRPTTECRMPSEDPKENAVKANLLLRCDSPAPRKPASNLQKKRHHRQSHVWSTIHFTHFLKQEDSEDPNDFRFADQICRPFDCLTRLLRSSSWASSM